MNIKEEKRTWTNDDKDGYKVKSPPKEKDPVGKKIKPEKSKR